VLYFPPITARVTAASYKWEIQTVDPNASLLGIPSIALDSSGNPHIAYYSDNGTSLMYASWNGSSWGLQKVDTFPINYFVLTCDLALDSSNNPHIVYNGKDGQMYASWNGAKWSIQTVDPGGEEGSLALDSAGNPHISFITASAIKYASWDGSTWNIQTIDSPPTLTGITYPTDCIYSSLSLDSNNVPHILFGYAEVGFAPSYDWAVSYASWTSSGWNIQPVILGVNPGITGASNLVYSIGNLALDSNGYPHFTYVTAEEPFKNGILYYESWNGKAWATQKVDSLSASISSASLAFDSHNNAIMTFPSSGFTSSNGTPENIHLTCAKRTGNSLFEKWIGRPFNLQTVDIKATAIYPGGTDLVLDNAGNLHIVYKNQDEVMYATTAENSHASTSRTVPELSWSAIVPLLLSVFSVAVLLGHRKRSQETLIKSSQETFTNSLLSLVAC
jgi:hypothetical protein